MLGRGLFLSALLFLSFGCIKKTEVPGDTQPLNATFQNPGGMWMPTQMGAHADTLKNLGAEFDPNSLTDPLSSPLGAIVSLNGCSASFVSPKGLVITNHHCVGRHLQFNSSSGNNYSHLGYLAKNQSEEKFSGPSERVLVTEAFQDVTEEVLAGLSEVQNDLERYKKQEAKIKELTTQCEKGRPGTRCTIAKFFDGAKFYRIEQLEILDVRLVYAPHEDIGYFGGDIDNWHWPRHCGDYSFLRAYVGQDGRPAPYSPENIPYQPKHFLKVASVPLAPQDLVMVAGYPGRTYRTKTAGETEEAVTWSYPRLIEAYAEHIKLLEHLTSSNEALLIKAKPTLFSLRNYLPNYQGILDGMKKNGLLEKKKAAELALFAWIDSDPVRKAKYRSAMDKIQAIRNEIKLNRNHDAALNDTLLRSTALSAAMTIVRMANERVKPDAERHPDYQERNWMKLEQSLRTLTKSYDRDLDLPVTKLYIQRGLRLPKAEQPETVQTLVGNSVEESDINHALAKLYDGTKLSDEEERVRLFKNASLEELSKSEDTFVIAAVQLLPTILKMQDKDQSSQGALSLVLPLYIEAMEAQAGKALAPDANSTLRITYGTVRGYSPGGDLNYFPFTKLSEVKAKHTGVFPFEVPSLLLGAITETLGTKNFGPYQSSVVGEIPVNFLADLDITGGNSGSATLNRKGELTGLVFDGNIEAIASNWVFMPEVTRSIHVDLRYALWIMDRVDRAHWILKELGITPTF